jgi:CBS domain-containing protein
MSVGEILKKKGPDVVTIERGASISDAVERLRSEAIGALVVSSDGNAVDGLISERDIVRGLADRGNDLLGMTVEDLMSKPVKTCAPEDGVEMVMLQMTEMRARHFPVVDNGRLVGIVSVGDVVKNRLEEVELETKVLRDAHIARA